jgi:hypothetical protein
MTSLLIAVWCTCCNIELDQDELSEPPIAQVWIWAVAFTLLFKLWNIALERMQSKIFSEVNQHNVTAADFAVLVTGLRNTAKSNQRLVDYAAHYGQVFAAFKLVAVGDALALCNKVRCNKRTL